jgi:hypothetical protein
MAPYFPSKIETNLQHYARSASPSARTAATIFARRTYSTQSARQQPYVHGSPSRSAVAHQGDLDHARLSTTVRSRPIAIPGRSTAISTRASATVAGPSFSWDTETLVDGDDATHQDPSLFSEPAPPQVSLINARAEVETAKARAQQPSLAPIVYGNGHWVVHPKPAKPTDDKSLAQQRLADHMQAQPVAGSSASQAQSSGEESPETKAAQLAFAKWLLVYMGYSYARQNTLRWDELSVAEQRSLVGRIADVTYSNAVRRIDERTAKQTRLWREERSAEENEGCCALREYRSGAVCERYMMWESDSWVLL